MRAAISPAFGSLKKLEAANHSLLPDEDVLVDSELYVREVTRETANAINSLAPFGVGNEKPVFVLHNIIPEKITRLRWRKQ